MGQLEQIRGLHFQRAHLENLILFLEYEPPPPDIQVYKGFLGITDPQKAR